MNEQSPPIYRLYFLDKLRRVKEWQALSCSSDEAALAQAASLIEDHIAVEVVEGVRIVGTILATNAGRALDGNGKPGLCCQ
jgi:hypothetical protein